jgi:DNA invertase Pin-like site-specific DNA recombinase
LRVSGRGQVEGHGFDRQEEIILVYVEKANYSIARVYQEEGAAAGPASPIAQPCRR